MSNKGHESFKIFYLKIKKVTMEVRVLRERISGLKNCCSTKVFNCDNSK